MATPSEGPGQLLSAPGSLAAATRELASRGDAALPDVLTGLAAALSVPTSVVLRSVDRGAGAVVAAAGVPSRHGRPAAIPRMRSADSAAVVSLPLRVAGRLVGFLTVIGDDELTEPDVALTEGFADLCALALAAARPRIDADRQVLDEEAERGEIAAALHEGPIGSLVAARYALETGATPESVRAVLERALRELRAIGAPLRPRPLHGDLARSVRDLVAHVRGTGCPVELAITDVPPDVLPRAGAVAAYRVLAAALDGVHGPATVVLETCPAPAPGWLTMTVTGASDPVDAGALDRWAARVHALDGRLERHPDGVTVHLPLAPEAATLGAVR